MKSILARLFGLWSLLAVERAAALAGTGNGASLIDGHAGFEVEAGARRADVIADAEPDGSRRANQDRESLVSYTLRGALGRGARRGWQAGGTVQLTDRERRDARSINLSELKLNVGYGALWPRIIPYVQLSVPVSRSAFEMGDPYQLDALGRGFWALGLGAHLTLPHGFFVAHEVHRSLPRDFANAENAGYLRPGFGATGGVGYGASLGPVTLGGAVHWTYEDPVFVRGDRVRKNGSAQRFATAGVNVGYGWGRWALALAYADQNILPAATTGLLREVSLSVTLRE